MGLFSEDEPKMMEVHGRQIKCVVCANEYFHTREAQLNTCLLYTSDAADE